MNTLYDLAIYRPLIHNVKYTQYHNSSFYVVILVRQGHPNHLNYGTFIINSTPGVRVEAMC